MALAPKDYFPQIKPFLPAWVSTMIHHLELQLYFWFNVRCVAHVFKLGGKSSSGYHLFSSIKSTLSWGMISESM